MREWNEYERRECFGNDYKELKKMEHDVWVRVSFGGY